MPKKRERHPPIDEHEQVVTLVKQQHISKVLDNKWFLFCLVPMLHPWELCQYLHTNHNNVQYVTSFLCFDFSLFDGDGKLFLPKRDFVNLKLGRNSYLQADDEHIYSRLRKLSWDMFNAAEDIVCLIPTFVNRFPCLQELCLVVSEVLFLDSCTLPPCLTRFEFHSSLAYQHHHQPLPLKHFLPSSLLHLKLEGKFQLSGSLPQHLVTFSIRVKKGAPFPMDCFLNEEEPSLFDGCTNLHTLIIYNYFIPYLKIPSSLKVLNSNTPLSKTDICRFPNLRRLSARGQSFQTSVLPISIQSVIVYEISIFSPFVPLINLHTLILRVPPVVILSSDLAHCFPNLKNLCILRGNNDNGQFFVVPKTVRKLQIPFGLRFFSCNPNAHLETIIFDIKDLAYVTRVMQTNHDARDSMMLPILNLVKRPHLLCIKFSNTSFNWDQFLAICYFYENSAFFPDNMTLSLLEQKLNQKSKFSHIAFVRKSSSDTSWTAVLSCESCARTHKRTRICSECLRPMCFRCASVQHYCDNCVDWIDV